jgi:hypothetical protein
MIISWKVVFSIIKWLALNSRVTNYFTFNASLFHITTDKAKWEKNMLNHAQGYGFNNGYNKERRTYGVSVRLQLAYS